MSFGARVHVKGIDVLIDAGNKLIHKGYNIQIVLTSTAKSRQQVLNYCKMKLGYQTLPNWLKLIEQTEDVASLMNEANCYVSAARAETFSLAICEATFMRVPIIQSQISDYFCPKSFETREITLTKNTVAIHHFDASWMSGSFVFNLFRKFFGTELTFRIKNILREIEGCMILLYFVDNLSSSGGIQRMLVNKINYLANNPHYTIHVVCFQKSDSFFKINPNISVHNLGIESMDSFFAKVSNLISLVRKTKYLLDQIKPDVVINENMKTMSFLLPWIKRQIPKVNVIHFSYIGQESIDNCLYKNSFHRYLIRSLRSFILKKYEKFIVLTEFDRKKWACLIFK